MAEIIFPIWLAAMAGDMALPFFLKPFYRGYSHKRHVLSLLGCRQSPVKWIYNLWCILSGLVFCAAGYCIFAEYQSGISVAIWILLALYGFGCETLSGIFPVEESPSAVTLSCKIHGVSSAVGCSVFVFVPLLLGIEQFRTGRMVYGAASILCFTCAMLFMTFFVMSEKERFRNTAFGLTGLWQRLLLFACYLPLALFGFILYA